MIDTYLIKTQDPSVKFKFDDNISLEQFIKLYINEINTTMSRMLSISVVNIYKQYFSLYLQASRIYPNFSEIMTRNSFEEMNLWEKVISGAIENKEIKPVDTKHYATLFRSCFLGLAFDRCLLYGLNIEELFTIYQTIYRQIELKS